MKNETCLNCRYWAPNHFELEYEIKDPGSATEGIERCLKRAPRILRDPRLFGDWPRTRWDDGCGEWMVKWEKSGGVTYQKLTDEYYKPCWKCGRYVNVNEPQCVFCGVNLS